MVKEQNTQAEDGTRKPVCGIVMPISAIDGCAKEHWSEVEGILTGAIVEAGFDACLVSNADDSGVIQKRIVQNLYNNAMVVCDVSCKNPNVMFELGMRLAFDKPTVVVMDDKTDFSFDTAPIEHLIYPRPELLQNPRIPKEAERQDRRHGGRGEGGGVYDLSEALRRVRSGFHQKQERIGR